MSEVLIAGATGGREHALGQTLADEGHTVYFSHGNGGSREAGTNLDLRTDAATVEFAATHPIDLVVVGPETPLVQGLSNRLRRRGVVTFGPNHDGAQLEEHKAFSADFVAENGIPSPDAQVAEHLDEAIAYIESNDPGTYVIKADGLAAGKGVVLPDSEREAKATAVDMMSGRLFGEAGRKIVFQNRLFGPELSAYVVADGRKAGNFVLLPVVQDHKRLKDGDKGPNTGGMGAYAPVPLDNDKLIGQIMDIGERTVHGVQRRGIDYRGVYFIGLMLDENESYQPKVIEYNVRFGDPETQPLLNVLKSTGTNLYDLLHDAAAGSLDPSLANTAIRAVGGAAMTVCLAADGYPSAPRKGAEIHGLNREYPGVTVYHGGTCYDNETGAVFVNGGRVLYVTGTGETVKLAAANAYAAIGSQAIHFAGMQYRTDIGYQAIR